MAVAISQTAAPAGVAASGNVATYSSASIGSAADDRIVVVVVATELASSTPSACTIGGATANAGTTGNFGAVYARVFWLPVPTGTTADIAVTYSATNPDANSNRIAVYRVTGGAFGATGGNGSTDMDATAPLTTGAITIGTGGGFIAVAGGATDTVAKTWANATEDLDVDAGNFRFTTATRTTSLTATAVTCTGTTNGEDGALSWIRFVDGSVISKSESVTVTESRNAVSTPALTQSEAAFYEDGTESGSTVIDSGADSITRDVSSGDSNLQLRVRLQETNAIAGASTDDYQLQYELNDSTSWVDVSTAGYTLKDSVTNNTSSALFSGGSASSSEFGQAHGQSFLTTSEYQLARLQLVLYKISSPTDNLYVEIRSGSIDGTLVATSNSVSGSGLLTDPGDWVSFDFSSPPTLSNATTYYWSVFRDGARDTTNRYGQRYDNSGAYTDGTRYIRDNNTWGSLTNDFIFRTYAPGPVISYDSASLTDGNATTNRLGSGSGSFVAGEISEDGLADNLQITASNYTELLYSLTIDSDAVADNDTLDFRVLRNGATSGMTYTVTPRITIEKAAGASTINKSESVTVTESVTVFKDSENVNKSESVTVTEALQREVENRIAVADTATLTESVKLEVNGSINVSETTTITEDVQRQVENRLVVSDSTTVTDAPIALIPELLINRSDSITVTDTPNVAIGAFADLNVSVSDTATITEALQRQVENRISVSDSSTASEALQRQVENYIDRSDSVTVTESVQREAENRIVVSDSTTVTESVQREAQNRVAVSDATTLTEALKLEGESRIVTSDTTTITESVQLSVTGGAPADYSVSVSDSASVTEAVQREVTSFVSRSDNVTLTEALQREVENRISVSDSSTVSEALARLVLAFLAVSDSSTVSEAVSVLVAFYNAQVSDSTTVTESVAVQIDTFVSRSESVTLTESLTVRSENNLSISDSISVSETVTVAPPLLSVNVSDSTSVADTATVFIDSARNTSVSDTVTLSESVALLIPELHVTASDSVATSESVQLVIPELFISTADYSNLAEFVLARYALTVGNDDTSVVFAGGDAPATGGWDNGNDNIAVAYSQGNDSASSVWIVGDSE